MPPKRWTIIPPMVGAKMLKNCITVVLMAYPVALFRSDRLFAMKMFCILKTRVIVRVAKIIAAMIHIQSCAKA